MHGITTIKASTDFVLKFETGADTDDADPYVCFRRREVRQIRKTRGRDAHSAEKLKKLRKELEEARELLAMIRQREITKKESLAIDRQLFEQRTSLRNLKQNLPDQYKQGDEDLLINQKVCVLPLIDCGSVLTTAIQKKKPLEINQRPPGSQLRLPPRPDGRPSEAELYTLADVLAEQERQIQEEIQAKIAAHQEWNRGFVDMTKEPLTPPLEIGAGSTFRTATTEYLPTPPASVSSEQSGDAAVGADGTTLNESDKAVESVAVRYASPSYDGPTRSQPSFRRRYGRGGRLWIDRRGTRMPTKGISQSPTAERFKFDDDDEEEMPLYLIDPFDSESMRFRARLFPQMSASQQQAARRAQLDAAAAAQSAQVGSAAATISQRRQAGD